MKVELVFGDKWIDVNLPDEARLITPVSGTELKPVKDLASTIRMALSSPLD
jgi:hypothetical protein